MGLLKRLKKLFNRETDEVTSPLLNEALVKFDLSEDFYKTYLCLKCGSVTMSEDDKSVGACACGSSEIWLTRGNTWVLSHIKEFWDEFETTNDIRIPVRSRKWLVGQEKPMERELMEIARWVYKKRQQQEALKNAQTIKILDLEKKLGKPVRDQAMVELNQLKYRVHFLSSKVAILEPSNFMKENPGPYVLRVSEPGCGKTLASKILDEEAADLYKENNLELTDVLTMENINDSQRPLVRQVPCHSVQGGGCLAPRIVMQAERTAVSEQKNKQQLIMTVLTMVIFLGGALVVTGLFILGIYAYAVGIYAAWFEHLSSFIFYFVLGMPLLVFPMFIMMIGSSFLMGGANRQDMLNTPYPIVQHDDRPTYVADATVSDSSTLMGSIQWNAYGNTPGLTGPLHKRTVAGIIHRQNDLIVDIDEIRNLQRHTAVELLDVMENGESHIRSRGGGGMGNVEATAITAISTRDPVPADFMLICNGNMDMLNDPSSILVMVKAFFDRFNYGDVVYFETHIDATPANELKIVQVVADEISRFRLYPMEKGGVRRIIEYMRSRADNNERFKIMFRYVIKVILKSFEISLVRRGEKLTYTADVERAIDEFCDTIQEQAMKEHLENRRPFKIIQSEGQAYGMVNGLAVIGIPGVEGRSAGEAFPVVAEVFPIDETKGPRSENFVVTGTVKDADSWVQDSKQHVRAAILKMYNKDIMEDYKTFISFAQQRNVEGPSAGVAMTLAVMSTLGDPRLSPPHEGVCPSDKNGKNEHAKGHRARVPMRQDVAMTGTIELIPTPNDPMDVRVGSIGGVPDKVKGAAMAGCKYVVIPQENFEHTLTQEKYPCEIFGADSILGYFDLLRADQKNIEALLAFKEPVSAEGIRLWSQSRVEKKRMVIS